MGTNGRCTSLESMRIAQIQLYELSNLANSWSSLLDFQLINVFNLLIQLHDLILIAQLIVQFSGFDET